MRLNDVPVRLPRDYSDLGSVACQLEEHGFPVVAGSLKVYLDGVEVGQFEKADTSKVYVFCK